MALNAKSLALIKAAALVVAGTFDQIPNENADEIQAQFALELSESNAHPKQTPVDLTENALDLSVAIADVIGNQKVTDVVTAIKDTAEDALEGNFFQLIGDLAKDFKTIKALKKG